MVTVKLAINVVLSSLVVVALQPRLGEAVEQAARADATLSDRLGGVPADLLFPAFVSGAARCWPRHGSPPSRPWGTTPFRRARARR